PPDEDHLLQPAAYDELAVDDVAEVTGAEPLVAAGLARRLPVAVVAGRDRRTPQLDLPDLAVAHRLPRSRIGDAKVHSVEWTAESRQAAHVRRDGGVDGRRVLVGLEDALVDGVDVHPGTWCREG